MKILETNTHAIYIHDPPLHDCRAILFSEEKENSKQKQNNDNNKNSK